MYVDPSRAYSWVRTGSVTAVRVRTRGGHLSPTLAGGRPMSGRRGLRIYPPFSCSSPRRGRRSIALSLWCSAGCSCFRPGRVTGLSLDAGGRAAGWHPPSRTRAGAGGLHLVPSHRAHGQRAPNPARARAAARLGSALFSRYAAVRVALARSSRRSLPRGSRGRSRRASSRLTHRPRHRVAWGFCSPPWGVRRVVTPQCAEPGG